MVTVDIKNAFGSVRKSDIPSRITSFIYSYWTERKIIVLDNE